MLCTAQHANSGIAIRQVQPVLKYSGRNRAQGIIELQLLYLLGRGCIGCQNKVVQGDLIEPAWRDSSGQVKVTWKIDASAET